ncbi:hypothetical protein EVAR_77421_1 [Eumeta japonica]|uniref:Uncharacterized protein n=1 Tax=Eumeta variegata TaxID=151549 RepID=A0A4C1UZ93_EUMVA|nr:hypothetical protein EVAR_77421_1 [Eumeta japonica]
MTRARQEHPIPSASTEQEHVRRLANDSVPAKKYKSTTPPTHVAGRGGTGGVLPARGIFLSTRFDRPDSIDSNLVFHLRTCGRDRVEHAITAPARRRRPVSRRRARARPPPAAKSGGLARAATRPACGSRCRHSTRPRHRNTSKCLPTPNDGKLQKRVTLTSLFSMKHLQARFEDKTYSYEVTENGMTSEFPLV